MSTTNDKVNGKTGTGPQTHDRGADKAATTDEVTRNFIERLNVTKVDRNAVPGSGEESADLLPDDEIGQPKSGT